MSQHSSPPIKFADTLKSDGGLSPSIIFNLRFFMKKYQEIFETVILASFFIISVMAIAPIT